MIRTLLNAGVLCLWVSTQASAVESFRLSVPAEGGIVWGGSVVAELRGCPEPQMAATLDGAPVTLEWRESPYADVHWATLTGFTAGDHELAVSGKCGGLAAHAVTRHFTATTLTAADVGDRVAWKFIFQNKAEKLAWNWGPGIFLYGLHRLSRVSVDGPAYREYIHTYHTHKYEKGLPTIKAADGVPPGLSALAMLVDDQDFELFKTGMKAARYVHDEKRNKLGALNHLGHAWTSHFLAKSIWVDSLMMYAVLATQWGAQYHDLDLRDWGAEQPLIFASKLRDASTGLYFHAWNVDKNRLLPASAPTEWLRGNGWVAVATVEILDALGEDHPQAPALRALLADLLKAAARYQMADGLWDTLMPTPGQGYEETSGSALIGYAMLKAAHRGWVDASFAARGLKVFSSITARLERDGPGYSMPGISWFTNPGTPASYKLIPRCHDLPYGVGAYLLLAAEVSSDSR
ncbi:MAG TPA: glycoside hydrolase family 88 protein [Bdellovibrionota bacterium]|nr:glycoside hydrolase family 88 protein [Bdellovibrionota bacterium]